MLDFVLTFTQQYDMAIEYIFVHTIYVRTLMILGYISKFSHVRYWPLHTRLLLYLITLVT